MSDYTFTTSGYIEIYFEDVLVSRHRLETEALESLLKHSINTNVTGNYYIKRPTTKVVFSASQTVPQNGTISSNAFFDLDGLGNI